MSYKIEDEVATAAESKKALEFIESHLNQQLNVELIAQACCKSAFHFSRRFTARHGESVMSYVRGRRLEAASLQLSKKPQVSLAQIALDCGFQSQAAFTRAFKRAFGEAPGKFRRSEDNNHRRRISRMTHRAELHERIELLDAFKVAGYSDWFNPSTFIQTPILWKRFTETLDSMCQTNPRETCGVFRERNFSAQSFEHLAGSRMKENQAVPHDFEVWTLARRNYLVYKQVLTDDELYVQVSAAQTQIWGERVPNSGHVRATAPDFQIYPANFNVGAGGWIEYYIPIES